jgi:hypothetical protein
MNCPFELASCDMIYIPIFINIGADIQVILTLLPKNLSGSNDGVTNVFTYRILDVFGSD